MCGARVRGAGTNWVDSLIGAFKSNNMASPLRTTLEAWLFTMRSAFLREPTPLPPKFGNTYRFDYTKKLLENTVTRKTLDEEAIECGLGHWFPIPAELSNTSVLPIFRWNGLDEWNDIFPVCVAAVSVARTRIPLDLFRKVYVDRQSPESVAAEVALEGNALMAQLIHSPRWLNNRHAFAWTYGRASAEAGRLLVDLRSCESATNVTASVQQLITNKGIPPVVLLLVKHNKYLNETVRTEIDTQMKNVTLSNHYNENVRTALFAKFVQVVDKIRGNHTDFIRFASSCEYSPVANVKFLEALQNESGVRNVSFKDIDMKGENTKLATCADIQVTSDLLYVMFHDRDTSTAAEALWDSFVRAPLPFSVPNVSALFHNPTAAITTAVSAYTFTGTFKTIVPKENNATEVKDVQDEVMHYVHEYVGEVPVDNCVAHAMRFENAVSKAAIVFTSAPELSAFRLHDTRLYAERYSRWVGDAQT